MTALVATAVARLVPLSIVQLYVHSAAAIVALWSIAYRMWRQPATRTAPTASHPRPTRAT